MMTKTKTISKKSIKIVARVAVIAIALFALFYAIHSLANFHLKKIIYINGQKIKVELAKTPSEKYQGLGGRKSLAGNEGMLFIYDGYYLPTFVMRDIRFPLDIIWVKDGMVVGWEKNISAPKVGELLIPYQPKTFINYVLEVNSGFIDKYNIKIGDKVEINL